MLPLRVVPSVTHLEIELMRQPAEELVFETHELEQQYERSDLSLAVHIEAEVCAQFPGTPSDELLFSSFDWWPNKSRSVVLSERAFCTRVVERLASLLRGEFADWRIHVSVCKALEPDPDGCEVGSLCILPGQIIIENSLSALLTSAA